MDTCRLVVMLFIDVILQLHYVTSPVTQYSPLTHMC